MSLHVTSSSNVRCMNCVHVHEYIYIWLLISRNWYASIAQNVNEYLTYIYHVQEEINMTQSSELKSHQTIWFPDKFLNGSPGTLLAIQVRNKRCKRVVYTRHTVNLLNPPQVLRFWFCSRRIEVPKTFTPQHTAEVFCKMLWQLWTCFFHVYCLKT